MMYNKLIKTINMKATNMNKREIVSKAWHDFFISGKDDVIGINNLIKESWQRSRINKIDYETQSIHEGDGEKRKLLIEKNHFLIDIVRPYMDDLYNIISETNFMITLLEQEGFVIDTLVHPTIAKISDLWLINYKEDRIGTNAMGTCLYLNKPVLTFGEEHCYKKLHKFTTSAAPIHDVNGDVIGCIGITGFADDASVHTLGMAIATAYAVENKIRLQQYKNGLSVKNSNILKDSLLVKTQLYSFDDINGESVLIKDAIEISKIASKGNSNVLILGESGTGKELFAQSIHRNSPRKDKPFIDINCGALPASLAESELFGYEGGSYTGSKKEGHPGKFELADGGTIFLDEIGELPLSTQASLLRVIQERKVLRIGSSQKKDIDVLIIAATNKDLFEAVKNNTFRKDLFYRLNVFTINLPPLMEHKEDIPILVNNLIGRYNQMFSLRIKGVSDEVMNIFMRYNWPGNIRELENIIQRAVQISKHDMIQTKDLPIYLTSKFDLNKIESNSNISLIDAQESSTILNVLKKAKGNAKQASEILGISRATLYRKLSKLGYKIDVFRN